MSQWFLFLVCISFSSFFCFGSDTILDGQSLFPNQTIISKGGKFELGFFSFTNLSNFYIAIWYKNIPVREVVWVANRNNPVRHLLQNSSRLELFKGNLYLYTRQMEAIPIVINSSATEAVILDTGNFVLRNAVSGIIWQSFDHPTDTWLPGGKVGFLRNSNNTEEAQLRSWRNPYDPYPGVYSLGMDPNGTGETFIRRDETTRYWRSGPLQGGTYASMPNGDYSYNFTFVSRDDGAYLIYNVHNESVLSRIVLDFLGRMVYFFWAEASQSWVFYFAVPYDQCNVYAVCGINSICDINNSPLCSCLTGFVPKSVQDWNLGDFSGGCVRRNPLQCFRRTAIFTNTIVFKLPEIPEMLEVGRSDVCEFACSVNCSCQAYAFSNKGGCSMFFGDMLDLERGTGSPADLGLFVKMDSEAKHVGRVNNNVRLLASIIPIIAAILVCIFLFWKLKRKEFQRPHQNILLLDLDSANKNDNSDRRSCGQAKTNEYELPIFSFSSISAATNNFSVTNKLGEGGFGPVYKGELLNRQFVAVKRLSQRSGQGLEEFKNETELIAKLQHRNLVGILGCCIEQDEKILVYEYMPNKSLDFFLFDPLKQEQLDWRIRVQIIEGIAQGLLYLHQYSRLRIVHRDLKASNILLDSDMNPKISDFGMARIFGGNQSQANTNRIVGTYGYMSPEYAMEGLFSIKSDVFAFGVLLLEILSGKKNTGFYGCDSPSLLGHAWKLWESNRAIELMDPLVDVPSSSLIPLRYIQVGLLCVQENPVDRPTMWDVVSMLNNEQTILASPQHPAFTVGRRTTVKSSPREGTDGIGSVNGLTLSWIEAR
ncbi:hypothetical protein RD792_002471 [Penstemon davidsonii]|uniref:Receptor-like serine/threonine-protein kinase n=1 Tax=Penstemon davidsonii TaxID=160366 RepID=A0ABR0DR65_9LAMI|nr:hypothetical protein RD792_002471 [Penstemon davidsonii]